MTTNYIGATDEIYQQFMEAVLSYSAEIVGYVPEIRFLGNEEKEIPELDKFWCRASHQEVTETQSTLNNGKCTKFEASGVFIAQIFAPKKGNSGFRKGQELSTAIKSAFMGKRTDNVVFFNARINNNDPEENWYSWNVIAEYEYTEIK